MINIIIFALTVSFNIKRQHLSPCKTHLTEDSDAIVTAASRSWRACTSVVPGLFLTVFGEAATPPNNVYTRANVWSDDCGIYGCVEMSKATVPVLPSEQTPITELQTMWIFSDGLRSLLYYSSVFMHIVRILFNSNVTGFFFVVVLFFERISCFAVSFFWDY